MSPFLVFIGQGSPDTQTILVVSGKCVLTVPAVGSVERLPRRVRQELPVHLSLVDDSSLARIIHGPIEA